MAPPVFSCKTCEAFDALMSEFKFASHEYQALYDHLRTAHGWTMEPIEA